jgi:hypothetical protein
MNYSEDINYIATILNLNETRNEHNIYIDNNYYIDYDGSSILFNYNNIDWAIECLNNIDSIKYNNNLFILFKQFHISETRYFKNHIELVRFILDYEI